MKHIRQIGFSFKCDKCGGQCLIVEEDDIRYKECQQCNNREPFLFIQKVREEGKKE